MFARTSSFARPLAARSIAKVSSPTLRKGSIRFLHEVANNMYSDSHGVGVLDISVVDVGTRLLAKDIRRDDVKLQVVVEDDSFKNTGANAQNSDLAMQEIEETIAAIASYKDKHEAVHNHFTDPHNIGSLDKKSSNVGAALVGKASRGGIMNLQVKVENGIIKDAKFKTVGCSSTVACGSFATSTIIGTLVSDIDDLTSESIASNLKIPGSKLHCAVLAEEAVRAAVANYVSKQQVL